MNYATYREFYDAVYAQDTPRGPSSGWIQWKGTRVCMDIQCECGQDAHIDDDFFYTYRCYACGAVFAVGQVVKLIRLTPEQVAYTKLHGCTIKEAEPPTGKEGS